MKLSAPIVPLIALAQARTASSTECGKWYSSPCVCDTDIKYCPDGVNGATDEVAEQHPFWKHYEGFWQYESLSQGTSVNPLGGRTNARFLNPSFGFMNQTTKGSRVYNHRYKIFPPNPDVNCSMPEVGPGGEECGSECGYGCLMVLEGYASSTPERDGTLTTTLKLQPNLNGPPSGPPSTDGPPSTFVVPAPPLFDGEFKQVPIDENTLHGSAISGVFRIIDTFSFINKQKTQASAIQEV